METKLVSIKKASKIYGFPLQKLYQLVEDNQVPYIEIQNLSGTKMKKINTRTFEEWLNKLAEGNKII